MGHSHWNRRSAFTLTEILVVIAIVAVLAGIVAAAVVNAMRASRRSRIQLEIHSLASALETFRQDFGAYPPNGINPNATAAKSPAARSAAALVQADFKRMFAKAFPRSREPQSLILSLCGQNPAGGAENLAHGINAAESLHFWLGGFSRDERFPISGLGGPSFATTGPNAGEVLESRNARFEFDLARLAPRTANGLHDDSDSRFVTYEVDLDGNGKIDVGEERRINFWGYLPVGSEQAYLYFDASRHKPLQYDPPASAAHGGVPLYALKQLREGVATGGIVAPRDLVFVGSKFQILHSGLDDDWGTPGLGVSASDPAASTALLSAYLYPSGTFVGPLADTLSNVTDSELAE